MAWGSPLFLCRFRHGRGADPRPSRLKQISPEGIVLAGVAVSSMLSAGTTLIQYFADEVELSALGILDLWRLGQYGFKGSGGTAALLAFFFLYCILHRWDYNAAFKRGRDGGQLRDRSEAIYAGQHDALLPGLLLDRFSGGTDQFYRAGGASCCPAGNLEIIMRI